MRRFKGLIIVGVLLVLALVIYSSMSTQAVSCEVCIEFNGRTQCRSATGANRLESVRTATTAAGATLSSGMDESMRCENTTPKSVTCRDK